MFLQGVIVPVIMRLPRVPPIADEAPLVLVAAMLIQLIVVVKSLAAETTQRVSLESRLVCGSRLIVSVSHVLLQLLVGEQFVLMREDPLVTSAQITHALFVRRLDMAVQVGPSQAGEIAVGVWAVVAEEEDGVAHDIFVGIFNADVVVRRRDVCTGEVFEALISIGGEDDVGSGCLESQMSAGAFDQLACFGWRCPPLSRQREQETYTTMSTVLVLVQCSHPQTADVACCMVAGCDRVVRNGIGANEADLSIVVGILLVDWGLSGADTGLVDGSREVLGGGVRQILAGITIVLAAGVSAPLVSASAAVASSSLSSSPLVLRATLGSRRWS
jgi:hypothetical protein